VRTIVAPHAPKAVGPYSHAVVAGGLAFLAGQIPLDPASMQIGGRDVGEQTRRVLDNIALVLEELGLTLDDVVKTTVYLREMADFGAMNEVYAARFGGHKPARTTIAVAGLPMGAMVEIECVARLRSTD
jgi:2-iminobutanoate/2-iminopropanoate deaminase